MTEAMLPYEDITYRSVRHYFGKNKSGWLSYIIGFQSVKGIMMLHENVGYSSLHFDDHYGDSGFGVMGYVEKDFEEIVNELSLGVSVTRRGRNDALHRKLKKQVDFICQVCGKRYTGKGELEVHPIEGVWNDNPSNLLVCCMSCHPEMECTD